MTRVQVCHTCSLVMFWGVALVTAAHKFVQLSCEFGNYLVFLTGTGTVDNRRQKGRTS